MAEDLESNVFDYFDAGASSGFSSGLSSHDGTILNFLPFSNVETDDPQWLTDTPLTDLEKIQKIVEPTHNSGSPSDIIQRKADNLFSQFIKEMGIHPTKNIIAGLKNLKSMQRNGNHSQIIREYSKFLKRTGNDTVESKTRVTFCTLKTRPEQRKFLRSILSQIPKLDAEIDHIIQTDWPEDSEETVFPLTLDETNEITRSEKRFFQMVAKAEDILLKMTKELTTLKDLKSRLQEGEPAQKKCKTNEL